MLNVLTHQDWREIYMFLAERAYSFQQEIENAASWDQYVVARALKRYTADYLMKLPEFIKDAKEEVERELAAKVAMGEDPNSPPEYERDE